MSNIENLVSGINETHKGMGNLIALCQIVIKAHKFMLIISPSGCGKSRAMEYSAKNTPKSWSPTSLSIANLGSKETMLNGFRSVITIDDISTIQTDYGRSRTITTLSALCYSHRVEPSMVGFDFCIEDFYGSALIGIQPIMLKNLMLAEEWDASIQDKALRYYHLQRPLIPNLTMPAYKIPSGLEFEQVRDYIPDKKDKYWRLLLDLGYSQWSRARTVEHLKDLLKAIASIENRKEVIEDDLKLLIRLLKPMAIENIAVVKEQLEGERYLDNNLLALLTEYYSYGSEISLADIALDFKCSLSQTYRIMSKQTSKNGTHPSYWHQISKSPTYYSPTKDLLSLLKNFNLEVLNK